MAKDPKEVQEKNSNNNTQENSENNGAETDPYERLDKMLSKSQTLEYKESIFAKEYNLTFEQDKPRESLGAYEKFDHGGKGEKKITNPRETLGLSQNFENKMNLDRCIEKNMPNIIQHSTQQFNNNIQQVQEISANVIDSNLGPVLAFGGGIYLALRALSAGQAIAAVVLAENAAGVITALGGPVTIGIFVLGTAGYLAYEKIIYEKKVLNVKNQCTINLKKFPTQKSY